ncbi:anthranilate/aminodeoxychorismate synthase component II, partial [Escherichia coli]|nr:anthranilate/aminodeoxychorismate synthase component II [Escherichia coli]
TSFGKEMLRNFIETYRKKGNEVNA